MRTLVLWDIDLTLLDLRRLGGSWFQQALFEVTGTSAAETPPFGGRTDRWIAMRLLADVGVEPTDELIDQLHAAAVRIADADRQRMADVGVVLPGVPEVLKELAARPEVVQTLVTGNLRPIAGFKVDTFGLSEYLDLDIGGYGGSSHDRSVLVADALAGTRGRHDGDFAVVVVGDTPHDVRAALAHQARAVGVATGSYSHDALVAAGAHAVLPDLGDTARVLAAILP
ncbi:MAG TPA: haloacid dehalogenase-like hydrolase [Pseudonocardiaceae bacterium]|nr:haloacid dehalogenase-like hydrolase [Pseudonocardiaceae bacterium]